MWKMKTETNFHVFANLTYIIIAEIVISDAFIKQNENDVIIHSHTTQETSVK
jgi:hypothetical protein